MATRALSLSVTHRAATVRTKLAGSFSPPSQEHAMLLTDCCSLIAARAACCVLLRRQVTFALFKTHYRTTTTVHVPHTLTHTHTITHHTPAATTERGVSGILVGIDIVGGGEVGDSSMTKKKGEESVESSVCLGVVSVSVMEGVGWESRAQKKKK